MDAGHILRAGVRAVDPASLVRSALAGPLPSDLAIDTARVCLVAAGKAAWPMTSAACAVLGDRISRAIGTGPRGPGALPHVVEWIDGAHPLPDALSVRAGEMALAVAAAAKDAREPLLVLLSGGGSSMLAAPPPDLPLRDKQAVIQGLLLAGADIAQLNCVRKHLSTIKGGRLAAAAGRSLTLAISDVHIPEDDPGTIASGPTAPDESTASQALDVLERLDVAAPRSVLSHLEAVRDGRQPETLAPGDPALAGAVVKVIANRRMAMEFARAEASRRGYLVRLVDPPTRGEARDAGRRFAELTLTTRPLAGPACLIASGETTVTVRGSGKGGRNQEFVLGAVRVLARAGVLAVIASAGTDGVDGPTDAAGAIASTATLARCEVLGIDLDDVLRRNDAYPALERLGDLIKWGPTLTNVGDLHVMLTMRA